MPRVLSYDISEFRLCETLCSKGRNRSHGRNVRRRKLCTLSRSYQHDSSSSAYAKVEHFQKNLVVPSQLVSTQHQTEHPDQQTVYTVRLSTGSTRGSGLSEPNAGVQLCLVGASGVALLHHISPVFDPQKLQEELDAINQVMDATIGANRKAIASATRRVESIPAGKQRFQQGGIDEISFLGPEISPIQSLLVAPESGSWRLEEASVSSSRSRTTSRFVCGTLLGDRGGAGYLAAVSPEGVVYGSGESLVVLSRNQARALHEAGMGKYSQFKKRVIEANISLVGIGTGLAWTLAGNSAALDFAYGGAGGLIYMSLLQHGTDTLALDKSTSLGQGTGYPYGQISKFIGSGFFRVAAVGICVTCAIYGTRVQDTAIVGASPPSQVQQLIVGALGFLMYKLAIVGVLSFPPLFQWLDLSQSKH